MFSSPGSRVTLGLLKDTSSTARDTIRPVPLELHFCFTLQGTFQYGFSYGFYNWEVKGQHFYRLEGKIMMNKLQYFDKVVLILQTLQKVTNSRS